MFKSFSQFLVIFFLALLACNDEGQKNKTGLMPLKSIDLPMVQDDLDESINNPFHRLPHFFLNDFTHSSAQKAYAELKGLQYHPESRVLVYITGPRQEGSTVFSRLLLAEDRVEITDNLIFIWMHLEADNSIAFLKKIYAGNLRKAKEKELLTL